MFQDPGLARGAEISSCSEMGVSPAWAVALSPNVTGDQKRYLPVPTIIRFFAALIVVTTHLNVSDVFRFRFVGTLLDAGYDAVALFFVLSGFIDIRSFR